MKQDVGIYDLQFTIYAGEVTVVAVAVIVNVIANGQVEKNTELYPRISFREPRMLSGELNANFIFSHGRIAAVAQAPAFARLRRGKMARQADETQISKSRRTQRGEAAVKSLQTENRIPSRNIRTEPASWTRERIFV